MKYQCIIYMYNAIAKSVPLKNANMIETTLKKQNDVQCTCKCTCINVV